jgi:hypothetical protein
MHPGREREGPKYCKLIKSGVHRLFNKAQERALVAGKQSGKDICPAVIQVPTFLVESCAMLAARDVWSQEAGETSARECNALVRESLFFDHF